MIGTWHFCEEIVDRKALIGHGCALFTMVIWGITFVSSKVLLDDLTPVELLFDRFLLALIGLTVLLRYFKIPKSLKLNFYAAAAAFFGITFYFVLENGALMYSPAANVSLLVSAAPFFVGIVDRLTGGIDHLSKNFLLGFVTAMVGIGFLSANSLKLELNPLGDLMAVGAAVCWGGYNLYVRRLYESGMGVGQVTQLTFFYGLILTLPLMLITGYEVKLERLMETDNLLNLLFLAVIASTVCFATWNLAVKNIGAVTTSVYLYAQPAVTAVFAVIFISEPVTLYTVIGMVLITLGLMLSQDLKILRRRT